ncbi:MAG: DUF4434 domain-containing protein [Subdoligranulum sp.]|nr:DUF4434 domain-containing protein [Subdoligranulum sp.]
MKKSVKKPLSIFLAFLLLLAAAPPALAEKNVQEDVPLLSGMFIATELVTHDKPWTQEDWDTAVGQLKAVGMGKIVLQYAVQYYSETSKVHYYTPGFEEAGENVNNRQQTYEYALEACRKNGMKIYLGLHLAEGMWFPAMSAGFRDVGEDGKSAFLTSSAEYSEKVFDDLWAQYGEAYGDVIAGWYLPYEFNNTVEQAARTRLVEDFYRPLTAHIKSVTPGKAIMVSPLIYPPMLTAPTDAQIETWKMLCYDVWANSQVDIIAPQDGCGWESSMKENLPPYYEAMAEAQAEAQAVRTQKGYGRAIAWNNPELYSMTGSNTMTMRRFTDNMRTLDPYVEEHVSFSVHSLVYFDDASTAGVNITNKAFYDAYAYMAQNGSLYEPAQPLPSPQGLTAEVQNGFDVLLRWERVEDASLELPVAGYQIRRVDKDAPDSEAILLQDVPQPAAGEAEVSVKDFQLEGGHTYRYAVYAYDGTGNLSGAPAMVEIAVESAAALRTVAAKGQTSGVELSIYAVQNEPETSASPDVLLSSGGGGVCVKAEERSQYVLRIVNRQSEPLAFAYLKVNYSPSEERCFPDKIEVLADGTLVNTFYPQREYGSSVAGEVFLPISLAGGSAQEKIELIITQKRTYFDMTELRVYTADPNVTVPEDYSEPENLVAGQAVAISGYMAGQSFDPNYHFRGVDRLVLDYEKGAVRSEYNMYKGNYASDLMTRGSVDLPYLSWQEDGGNSLLPGRAGDSDRSVWLRTIDLGGASFDLSVDLPTPQAIGSVSTEWLSDRDATVFLPLYIEYYGMTQGGVEQLIGTAYRPSEAQIDFSRPPAADNCHRTGSFRYKVLDVSGTVYTKVVARVYPQYPANSHFMRAFAVYR